MSGAPPDSSAGLDVSFQDKGFLLPRLNYNERYNIHSPAEGLIIYCTNCNPDGTGALSIFQNGSWHLFNLNCARPSVPPSGVKVPYATEILWSWNPVPIADGYMWNDTNDFGSATDLGDTTSFLETGLTCWTNYDRYVWAYNECGESFSLKLSGSTIESPFSPAPTPFLILPTTSTILWSWTAVPGALGYRTSRTINDFYSAHDLGDSLLILDTGLDCLTEVTRYVWAYDDCGFSPPRIMTATTTSSPPAAPVAANHVATPTQVTWNWNAVTGADEYILNDVNDTAGAIYRGTSITFAESNLTCLTEYTRYIWAYSECGLSNSTPVNKTTLSDPPAQPVAATNIPGQYQVIWNWNPVEGADGYRWSTENNYNDAEPMGIQTSKTETGLNCNTSYNRYVWAYTECGVSQVTTLTQKTLLDPPGQPDAAAHTPSETQIIWNWTAVTGATGYKWNTVNDTTNATNVFNNTNYSETGLTCNTNYTRFVWAYSSCGTSTACTLNGKTALDPPESPIAATHTPDKTEVVWRWNAVAGATGYKWNDENDTATAINITNTSYTETGLICNTDYTRYVWAYSNCGVSPVTSLSQTTSLDPPAAPIAAAHVAEPYQITWNWNLVNGASGYLWSTVNDTAFATNLGSGTYTEALLACDSAYTRYVWAYSNCGVSNVTTLTMATLQDPPDPVIAATHVATYNTITWNWNAVDGADGYRWGATNDLEASNDIGNITTKPASGFTCLTMYYRYIWAYNECGISAVTMLSQSTTANPPSTPTPGTHVATASSITWNWNAVADATGYKWGLVNDYDNATEMGTIRTKTQNDLTCNTPYTCFVWAYSSCGVSTVGTFSETTAMAPPASPQAAAHIADVDSITWNWNAVSGATGYKWSAGNDFGAALDLGNLTSWNETGLACNDDYIRFVWAYNGTCGNSSSTTLTSSTLTDPPDAPVAATHIAAATQILWKWQQVPDATGYKWNSINDPINGAITLGPDTSYQQGGLVCQTGYTSYVWAIGACGESSSCMLTQSTTSNPPAVPEAGTHIATASEIEWHFNTVPNATGYKWSAVNTYSGATDLGTNTTWTESGLDCDVPYTRYVWAYGPCGVSASAVFTHSTLYAAPDSPLAGTHSPAFNQITWNWNTVTGATGYLWNDVNNPQTAINTAALTTSTQQGLDCNTLYTSYAWAYNDCDTSVAVTLNQLTSLNPPVTPTEGTHIADIEEIEWHWNTVSGATGYKWNTVNDTTGSLDLGNVLTTTQSGLTCNLPYTSYVWAYSNCGVSASVTLTFSTLENPPLPPVAGTHAPSGSQITWNWEASNGATGYKWNTTDTYGTATDLGNVTSTTEIGLACNTLFTHYLWAYSNCGVSTSTVITMSTTNDVPGVPVAGTHDAFATQITWNWSVVPGASGYKWSATNNYATATNMGTATSYTESGLSCDAPYTRYVWAYNGCGNSTETTLTESTYSAPLATPVVGTHVAGYTEVTWNWNTVSGATGYKWSTTDNFGSANDNGTSTSWVQTNLACGTGYTSYAWAYDGCGNSTSLTMTQTTLACWTCNNPLTINHVADTVAPVTKTVTYGTVSGVPGETTKCWITSNLGSDHQAADKTDATEASAGWYWQFNRARGFKHDGTTRTPNTTWIPDINEYSVWITNSDPCFLELGTGWRVPTGTEWTNVDVGGGWTNWNGPWNSILKIHAAGRLDYYYGTLSDRGAKGLYWSSSQTALLTQAQSLYFFSANSILGNYQKSYGHPVRCIHNP